MIKKSILLSLGLLPLLLQAQIAITTELPPAGLVQKDQLWNIIAINNTGKLIDVRINMSLQDQVTGQVVLSASGGTITLDKGAKMVTAKDVQPIQYNYSSPEYSKSFLPIGTYTVCYQIVSLGHGDDGESVLGNDCVTLDIEPLSPPLLNMPEDKADLQSPYPQFNWMPPSPFMMFDNLSYDILVTEVLPGQSSSEAIQYNIPVYSRSNIIQPVDNYPSSYPKLDTTKTYAWQVIARNGATYAAKTDVWTFRIHSDQKPVDSTDAAPFVQLTTSGAHKGVAPNGVLKIVYYNKSNRKKLKVTITDLTTNSDNNAPVEFTIDATAGENYIQYDLNKIIHTEDGNVYMAEIVDGQNEKWFIQFVVKNYNK